MYKASVLSIVERSKKPMQSLSEARKVPPCIHITYRNDQKMRGRNAVIKKECREVDES